MTNFLFQIAVLVVALFSSSISSATTCGAEVYTGETVSRMYKDAKIVGIFEVLKFQVDEDSNYFERKISKLSFRPIKILKGQSGSRIDITYIVNSPLEVGGRYLVFFNSGKRTHLQVMDNNICSEGLIFNEEESGMYVNLVKRIKWCSILKYFNSTWCDDPFGKFNNCRFLRFGQKNPECEL